jgi:hypothetical protein
MAKKEKIKQEQKHMSKKKNCKGHYRRAAFSSLIQAKTGSIFSSLIQTKTGSIEDGDIHPILCGEIWCRYFEPHS